MLGAHKGNENATLAGYRAILGLVIDASMAYFMFVSTAYGTIFFLFLSFQIRDNGICDHNKMVRKMWVNGVDSSQ